MTSKQKTVMIGLNRIRNNRKGGDSVAKNRKRPTYAKLKGFFVSNRINQSEPAEVIGVTRCTFNQKINGLGSDFSLDEARKLCAKYNLEMGEYFYF